MKKLLFIFVMSAQILHAQDPEDLNYLHNRRLNEASFVEMHNISLYMQPGWEYPSPTGNQNFTVPQALEYANEQGAILSIKTPAHWTEELGEHEGKGPVMASHGMYRNTFMAGYFSEGASYAQNVNTDIEAEFKRLAAIPIVGKLIGRIIEPLKQKYEKVAGVPLGYLYWSKPVAQMERTARELTYGSSKASALVPFTPCVIDPSSRPLAEVLTEVKRFLDANRHQLVIFKFENVTDNTDIILKELHDTQLDEYAYKQNANALWPKIGELIQSNKRFIPFISTDVHRDDTCLNAEDDFIWSPHWNYQTKEELVHDHHVPENNQNYQRWESGKPVNNALYTLPCHLTQGFAGRPDLAREVNTEEVITERKDAIGKGNPTFLAVDFIDENEGEAFKIVRTWNEK